MIKRNKIDYYIIYGEPPPIANVFLGTNNKLFAIRTLNNEHFRAKECQIFRDFTEHTFNYIIPLHFELRNKIRNLIILLVYKYS